MIGCLMILNDRVDFIVQRGEFFFYIFDRGGGGPGPTGRENTRVKAH